MEKLNKWLSALSLGAALTATGCTYVTNLVGTTPGQQTVQNDPVQQADERPNYLQSLPSQAVIDSMTPLQKRVESLMQLTLARPEQDNPFPVYMNGCARADLDIHGSTVHLYLPFYTPAGDGKWRYRPDNTIVDSQPILDDLEATIEDGVNLAYEEYAGYSDRTNTIIERVFPNASRDKDDAIAGTGLTNNDVFGLIDIEKANFLPDGANIIFAPDEGGTYAITQLERNTILYTPDARRSDAIWGRSWVLAHELVHNNHLLQNVPSLLETELELQTFTLNIADKSNLFLFLKHGYGGQMRESAMRYFGFDAAQIYDRLVTLEFDNYIEIDEQYLMEMAPSIVNMVDNFHGVMMEYSQPEYQAMMPWWLMAEAYFRNDALPLEVGVAARFNPNTLSPQQMQKISQNRQQIERMIEDVRSGYTMPEMGSFFGMTFTDGDTFEDAVYNRAKSAGYDEQQCDFIYDLAMEKVFVKGNGINYAALSVDNAIEGMADYMDIFDELMTTDPSELSRGIRAIAASEAVKHRYEAYQWMQDRLETADRQIGFAERAGRHPSRAFDPRIFDPRADLTTMYSATPEFAQDALESDAFATETLDAAGSSYTITSFDIMPDKGIGNSEVDYVTVVRQGDTRPCIVAFAGDGKLGDQMLVDFGANGNDTDGMFDEEYSIDKLKDIRQMLKGHAPEQ